MRTKAIQDLAQLPDEELFAVVATGTSLCLANAKRIEADAEFLGNEKKRRGSEILRLASQEEAAKVLILLDAIRCPKERSAEFSRQLQYFNQHLAKGIYAEYFGTKPATFREVRELVEIERREYYLDGPSGVDWIYYNEILSRREGTIYVDYVDTDGDHRWLDPLKYEELGLPFARTQNSALRVCDALERAGSLRPEGLAVMANSWREVAMTDDFRWVDVRERNLHMLSELASRGGLRSEAGDVVLTIANDWLFPLWSLDLSTKKVDKRDLREIQKQWSPDGNEMY
jgi:AbiV family abortive infection protein